MKKFCSGILACIMLCSLTGCNTEVATSSHSSDTAQEVTAKDIKDLDLHKPNECMLFMETVLSEIEKERRLEQGSILKYSVSYGVKELEDNAFVITIHDSPTSQIYIIADAATNEYRYLDVSVDYELLGYDEVEAQFSCKSGQTGLRYPNFPYKDTYNFADKQWTKVHMPINRNFFFHKLGGHPYSFGTLDRVEITDAKAEIIFNFKEFLKDPSFGSGLPVLYYWYDPIANKATLSFSGIKFSNSGIIKQLERLPGITNAQIVKTDAIDLDALAHGVKQAAQMTFEVSTDYNLYGEYSNVHWVPGPADEIENNEMSFRLWTEKK